MQDFLFIGKKSSGKSFIINSLRSGKPTHIENQTLGVQKNSIPSKFSERITYPVKKVFLTLLQIIELAGTELENSFPASFKPKVKYLVIVYEPTTEKQKDLQNIQQCFKYVKDNSLEIESPVLIIENYKSPTLNVDSPINSTDINSILRKLDLKFVFYITSFCKSAQTEDDKITSIEQLHKLIDTIYAPLFTLMLKSNKKPPQQVCFSSSSKQSSVFASISKNILFPMLLLFLLSTLTH